MKDDLSQKNKKKEKNTGKYDIFFQCSEKMVFPKKTAPVYDLSYIMRKNDISFSRKYDNFLRTENER